MGSYEVKHIHTGQKFVRPHIFQNPLRQDRTWPRPKISSVESFHRSVPEYGETRLHSLPSLASELGVGHLFVKDESNRFSMPAFKILGASWAIHKTICQEVGISPEANSFTGLLDALKTQANATQLVTCSVGNWGRALARMAKHLSIPARVYVPDFTSDYTKRLISSEGAELRSIEGSYDDALTAVQADAANTGALHVQDFGWEGYADIPGWATEGYSTMLLEADRQVASAINGAKPTLVFAGVGGGLWAQAVVTHYRAEGNDTTKIITVEADTAAGFKESLHCGERTAVSTGNTIMAGLNGGTTDPNAWPLLRDGVDVAVVVTDQESHESVQYLQDQGIDAGPCGAATLAALRKLCREIDLPGKSDMVVVLFSTEGNRFYRIPQ